MLPFVSPPAVVRTRRIGNARCGVLEVEERGGLTVAEDDAIAVLLAEGESAFVEAAKAADAIATAENNRTGEPRQVVQADDGAEELPAGLSIVEAFDIIKRAISGDALSPDAEAIRLRHAETIQHVAAVFARSGQRNMEAGVTALVRSRLARPEWGMDDTRAMDRVLFRGLHQLLVDEQAAEGQEDEPPTEEEVGKPPAGSGNSRRRTGRKSSGPSAATSPASSTATPSLVS